MKLILNYTYMDSVMCTCVFSDNTYTQKNFVVIIKSDQYCENVVKNLDFFFCSCLQCG